MSSRCITPCWGRLSKFVICEPEEVLNMEIPAFEYWEILILNELGGKHKVLISACLKQLITRFAPNGTMFDFPSFYRINREGILLKVKFLSNAFTRENSN